MPVKPLPVELVERLKQRAPQIEMLLGGMRNVDARKTYASRGRRAEHDVNSWGGRVRELGVSRNFPGVELVIKRHVNFYLPLIRRGNNHAQVLIDEITHHVDLHNSRPLFSKLFSPKYQLLKPHLYSISNHLIAMHKCEAPTLDRVFAYLYGAEEDPLSEEESSKIKQVWGKVSKAGLTADDLSRAYFKFLQREKTIRQQNDRPVDVFADKHLFFLGVENGKFQFMPLADDY